MKGVYLTLFVPEKRRLHGLLAYEWLLEKAKESGIPGGSAFRAIAGYGRHGVLHEQHFFELQGELSMEVVFALGEADALRQEGLTLFYAKMPGEFGMLNGPDGALTVIPKGC